MIRDTFAKTLRVLLAAQLGAIALTAAVAAAAAAEPGADLGPNTLVTWTWTPPADMHRADQSYAFGNAMMAPI